MKSLDKFLWVTIGFLFLCIVASFVFLAIYGVYPEALMDKLIIYTLGEGGICGLIKAVKLVTVEKAERKAENYNDNKIERT